MCECASGNSCTVTFVERASHAIAIESLSGVSASAIYTLLLIGFSYPSFVSFSVLLFSPTRLKTVLHAHATRNQTYLVTRHHLHTRTHTTLPVLLAPSFLTSIASVDRHSGADCAARRISLFLRSLSVSPTGDAHRDAMYLLRLAAGITKCYRTARI